MYHRPRLPNGEIAPLAWQIRMFYISITWPVNENAKWPVRLYDWMRPFVALLLCGLISESELNFIVRNINDIGLALESLATCIVLLEVECRMFHMSWQQKSFKNLLDEFYLKIYIEEHSAPQVFADIELKLRPSKMVSYSYIITLITYYMVPIMGLIGNQRIMPYRMTFHYDINPLYNYIPTLAVCVWAGAVVVAQMGGEINTLSCMILHLNGRYVLMQQDFACMYKRLKKAASPERILPEFQRELMDTFRRNAELNDFAAKLQAQYSFRLFVIMSYCALLLCVLAFKAVTLGASSENITYVIWIIGKVVELIVIGQLGTTLTETTDNLSAMYYLSDWENVIMDSCDTEENVRLMKLINMGIALNKQPFYLSGLNYFRVSLSTALTILQGAGSYFTCLYTFKE